MAEKQTTRVPSLSKKKCNNLFDSCVKFFSWQFSFPFISSLIIPNSDYNDCVAHLSLHSDKWATQWSKITHAHLDGWFAIINF